MSVLVYLHEMEYWSREKYLKDYEEREMILLAHGEYNWYDWFIVSYCTHPCAYIVIDEDTYGYMKYDHEIELDVHGGVTYSYLGLHEWVSNDKWVIGWDYNHYGDYSPIGNCCDGKKYTTCEVYEDVKGAINQLRGLP